MIILRLLLMVLVIVIGAVEPPLPKLPMPNAMNEPNTSCNQGDTQNFTNAATPLLHQLMRPLPSHLRQPHPYK